MMVGDREHDIFGARHNGIETIAVSYGYGSQEELEVAQPKYKIDRFNQLLDYFK
jgi:phosphoglycolate phosphatase